jgi:RNA polymerase sigma-70 factor, ECF subfamily
MREPSGAASSMPWVQERADENRAEVPLARELEVLYQAHAETLLRYAVSATASLEFAREAVQEVFLRYAELRQAEPTPPTPLVWLLRTLRAHIARRTRDSDRRETGSLSPSAIADPAPSPETLALLSEARRIIDRLAAPRELECFLLRSEGLSYQEIATIMDISIGTVGATLARAVRKLEQVMESEEGTSR